MNMWASGTFWLRACIAEAVLRKTYLLLSFLLFHFCQIYVATKLNSPDQNISLTESNLSAFFRLFGSCCSHLRRLENTDNLYKILNKNVLARGLGAWTEFTFSLVFKKSVIFMNEITFGMHFLLQWKVCFCKSEYIIVFHLLRIFRFEYCMHNIHKLNHYAPKETLSIFFKKIIELNNFLKLILMFSLNLFFTK